MTTTNTYYIFQLKDYSCRLQNVQSSLTLFPMGYFPTDFPWEVVAASPTDANDFFLFFYKIC